MIRSAQMVLAAATLLASAVPMMAGGLFVVLGNPEASQQARGMGAVLTLKLAGCHEPEKADVSAIAIGTVNNQRQSIRLNLTRLSEAGTYAVTRQWPATGRWVLQFVGKDGDRVTSTLVAAGTQGVEREKAVMAMRLPADTDVTALLTGEPSLDAARH